LRGNEELDGIASTVIRGFSGRFFERSSS